MTRLARRSSGRQMGTLLPGDTRDISAMWLMWTAWRPSGRGHGNTCERRVNIRVDSNAPWDVGSLGSMGA